MLNIAVYVIGWLLFVAAQCKNSLNSKTNSLAGWPGVRSWLASQSVNLATRAFFCAIGYSFLVHTVAAKIDAVGFHVTSTMISGFAGYGANGMLYQLFGLFPGLRVEVADLAPPANAQVVPIQTSNGPNVPLPKPPTST